MEKPSDEVNPVSAIPQLPTTLPSALEKLGPSPFLKARFPFLGFLATVYEHVATHVGNAKPADDAGSDPDVIK